MKKGRSKVTSTVQLPEAWGQALRQTALEQGVSINDMVRQALAHMRSADPFWDQALVLAAQAQAVVAVQFRHQITIDLPRETDYALEIYSQLVGTPKTVTVRRAIRLAQDPQLKMRMDGIQLDTITFKPQPEETKHGHEN